MGSKRNRIQVLWLNLHLNFLQLSTRSSPKSDVSTDVFYQCSVYKTPSSDSAVSVFFFLSASSAATDHLLGGTFLSCAVLVQKNNTTETKITQANDNLCSLHRTFAFVILQQPPCSIIQDDFFVFVFDE